MGYLKEKYLESRKIISGVISEVSKETNITIQKYKGEKGEKKKLTEEEKKQLDNIIDCQIEDLKFKRDEGE